MSPACFRRGALHGVIWALALAPAVALGACSHARGDDRSAPRAAIEAVRQAEAEFAVETDTIGIVPAFRRFVGPDAIMFLPYPVVVNPRLETANWPGNVDWRPSLAVASSQGDIVVTAGPSLWTTQAGADPGFYFTIWRRQADGAYRFALDGSAVMPRDLYTGANPARLDIVAEPAAGAGSIESMFAAEARRNAEEAFAQRLDEGSHILRNGHVPAIGIEAARILLAEGPGEIIYVPEGGGASASNDIVWSYGRAQWREGEAPREGVYVRVWRSDGATWRIALDHLATVAS